MPRIVEPKSPAVVNRLRDRPGDHAVGGVRGLLLQVTKNAKTGALRRSWLLKATVGDRRREIGLGPYPDLTLEGAREAAREARALIAAGIDPVDERRRRKAALAAQTAGRLSFEEAAKATAAKVLSTSKNPDRNGWLRSLELHAFPKIGKKPVDEIGVHDVLAVLNPIWSTKTETAGRVRGRIEAVLSWATVNKYREGENPARWENHLDQALAKPSDLKPENHFAALPHPEAPAFLARLRERPGIAARALELLILTAVRPGALIGARGQTGATWDEFDLDAQGGAFTWTIPAERMRGKKTKAKAFTVTLSPAAVALLRALPRGEGVVFPIREGALGALLKRMKADVTAHGFRATFKTWATEQTGFPHAVVEMALAHTIKGGVERAYQRGELLKKRRALMEAWAAYVSPAAGANVRPLRKA